MSTYNPQIHHRHSIRLRGYDYTQNGAYCVTMCIQNRECLFGEITGGEMLLNEYGEIVRQSWQWIQTQYPYAVLGEWTIMPNHLHGIIVIDDGCANGDIHRNGSICVGGSRRGGSRTAPTCVDIRGTSQSHHIKPLGRLIGAYKTVSTKQINVLRNTPGVSVWQRNYYEHIIRSDDEYNRIVEYIINNPKMWEDDTLWTK